MEISGKTVNAGDPVWITGRDGNGYFTTSFMFIAAADKYAILSPYFADKNSAAEVLECYADKFACSLESDTPPFLIVPKENCYTTQKQAEEALCALVFGENSYEILFRGKSEISGSWIHGSLVMLEDCDFNTAYQIVKFNGAKYNVVSETVGRRIGMDDINGRQIFGGDFCRNGTREYLILWLKDQCAWGVLNLHTGRKMPIFAVIQRYGNNFEIIGNRYDNPEMLKEPVMLNETDAPVSETASQPVFAPATAPPENFQIMHA